jgi:hypothetical protein
MVKVARFEAVDTTGENRLYGYVLANGSVIVPLEHDDSENYPSLADCLSHVDMMLTRYDGLAGHA